MAEDARLARGDVVAEIDLPPGRRLRVVIVRGDDGPLIDFRASTRLNAMTDVYMTTGSGFSLNAQAATALVAALQGALAAIAASGNGDDRS